MATTPDIAPALQADPLSDFVLVRTDQVDRGDRLRPIDMVWAEALGQVMTREGQRTPIEVARLPGSNRWTLVSGGHRHAGAAAAGMVYLRAEIVSANRDDRRMREVSENLWRRDLAPIDRAAFIAEAVALHKRRAGIDPAIDGRAGSANARWQKDIAIEAEDANVTMTFAYGFTDLVAAELGFSKSTVARDLMLYRRLVPSVVEELRAARHRVLTHAAQLKALAKLEEGKQRRVAVRLTLHDAKTIAEAIAQLEGGKPAADPEAKRLSTFIGAFSRMGIAEKRGALAHLAGLLPVGLALADTGTDAPVPDGAKAALDAAFDFFVELDKWDPASALGMVSDLATSARAKVQMALFSANAARRPA